MIIFVRNIFKPQHLYTKLSVMIKFADICEAEFGKALEEERNASFSIVCVATIFIHGVQPLVGNSLILEN